MLLPWYVNLTLADLEKAQVDAHLKNCIRCRMELADLQKMSSLVRTADSNPASAELAYAGLKSRIQDSKKLTEAQVRRQYLAVAQTVATRKTKIGFRIPVFAQAAVILLMIGFLWFLGNLGNSPEIDHEFHTLSSDEKSPLKENELRVVFVDRVSDDQIDQILKPFHGKIIAGPNAQGVYIVGILPRIIQERGIGPVMEGLRENKQIIFAEPAFSALSSNIKQ